MTSTTSSIKIRKTAFEAITSVDIDNTIACQVKIYITANTQVKDAKIILKHDTKDCKRLAFKQARHFIRKHSLYSTTANLSKRLDLTLTHRVVTLKINNIKVKVNQFIYKVNDTVVESSAADKIIAETITS